MPEVKKLKLLIKKDPTVQLKVSELSIKDLLRDLLNEIKGFKYQMTLEVKSDGNIEYSPVYFSSTTKTVINFKFDLDQSFQEIIYRIDNWISEGSGWIIEQIHNQYLNVSSYCPLIGSTYIELPNELKHSRKELINIQNDDNKCFLWCHIRHLNLVDKNPQKITKEDREFVNKLNYEGINFPVSKKDYFKIEMSNKICINVFCYENKIVYPVYLSDQKFDDSMDLLLISNKIVSHYVYIKDFNRFMFNKTKNKNKKYFCMCCLQFISFKNYSKQIPAPFKIYVDFECILKNVDNDIINNDISYTKKDQDHVPCSFAYKVVCTDNEFSKKLFCTEERMLLINLLNQFLVNTVIVKK